MSFEIVDMSLEERSKFRRLLADSLLPGGVPDESAAPVTAPGVAASR